MIFERARLAYKAFPRNISSNITLKRLASTKVFSPDRLLGFGSVTPTFGHRVSKKPFKKLFPRNKSN
jgi:hypothetical protein